MIRFDSDYLEGCHPRILERLAEMNLEQTPGYGLDPHCARAAGLIREACGTPEAEVHFLVGGTQTNTTVIKSLLTPCQGVLCADTGHVNVHEAGAIEATGHRVWPLASEDGTLCADRLRAELEAFADDPTREHRVQPGMVYVSHPTENGTLYGRGQLEALSAVCREHGLPLYLDGARLGYGVVAEGAELSLPDVARLCDVFYIGGTKVGALFGEAVVFPRGGVRQFRTLIKQQGGLLAKGRLLGIQFEVLFEDGLYFELARRADALAMRIRSALQEKGFAFLHDSVTNQQFPILPDEAIARLRERFSFEVWQRLSGGRSAVRFCTSWATLPEDAEALAEAVRAL